MTAVSRQEAYAPTRAEFLAKTVAEVTIAAVSIFIALWIWRSDGLERDRLLEQQQRESAQAAQSNWQAQLANRRHEILNVWLPVYLSGEDADLAESMMLALDVSISQKTFSALQVTLSSSGLLTPELEARLAKSVAGATRARVENPVPLIEIAKFDDHAQADDLRDQLLGQGIHGVEIRQVEGSFAVVVTGVADEALAALIRDGLGGQTPSAETSAEHDGSQASAAVLPNVYQLPELDALRALADAGFTNVVVWRVTSGSVGPGLARQLVVSDGSAVGNETVLVDRNGPTVQQIPANTKLALKVVKS